MRIAIIAVIWVVCGILNYGIMFAYFERRFPTVADRCYKRTKSACWATSLGGPVGLAGGLLFLLSNKIQGEQTFYGFQWKHKENQFQA